MTASNSRRFCRFGSRRLSGNSRRLRDSLVAHGELCRFGDPASDSFGLASQKTPVGRLPVLTLATFSGESRTFPQVAGGALSLASTLFPPPHLSPRGQT